MIPDFIFHIFLAFVFLSLALCLWRVVRGPDVADRMVGLDLLGMVFLVLITGHSLYCGERTMIDVAVVFSIITFFGAVAVARYLQRDADNPPPPPDSNAD